MRRMSPTLDLLAVVRMQGLGRVPFSPSSPTPDGLSPQAPCSAGVVSILRLAFIPMLIGHSYAGMPQCSSPFTSSAMSLPASFPH
jgi:hypothetical protein